MLYDEHRYTRCSLKGNPGTGTAFSGIVPCMARLPRAVIVDVAGGWRIHAGFGHVCDQGSRSKGKIEVHNYRLEVR